MTDRSVWAVDTPGVEHRASDVRAQIYTAHSGDRGSSCMVVVAWSPHLGIPRRCGSCRALWWQ